MKLKDVLDLTSGVDFSDYTLAAFGANSQITEEVLRSLKVGEVVAVKGKSGRIRLVMKVKGGVVGVFIPRRYDQNRSTEHQINEFLRSIARSRKVSEKV